MAIVLTGSLIMHVRAYQSMERMAQENSRLAERLGWQVSEVEEWQNTIYKLRVASYMMADPTTRPLMLEPMGNGGNSYHGVLLVSGDGLHALLMVDGMSAPQIENGYQVWLTRPDKKMPLGPLEVDNHGWGATSLQSQVSLFGYDWVVISMSPTSTEALAADAILLRSKIPSDVSSR